MLRSLYQAALVLSVALSAVAIPSWPSLEPEAAAILSLLTKPVPNTGHNPKTIKRTYVVPHVNGQDDSPALLAAIATGNYSTDTTILFKQGVTYNIWTPLTFPSLSNVEIAIEGNISLPTNISAIQAIVAHSGFSGYWFKATGSNITFRGSLDPKWGWINSYGTQWWNIQQQTNRPHLASFAVTNGVLRNMKILDSIGWVFTVGSGTNVHVYGNYVDCKQRPNGGFPFNTDGFSASGTNILLENNIVFNGDDCLTVGSGANGVHFRDSYCQGGHGLSIGSLGSGGAVASVHNVLMENVLMVNELYGARFKSWTGGAGIAQNVTWKDIYVKNVPFPIYVTQNYWDQGVGPKPNTTSPSNTHIADMKFINFAGTLEDVPYVEGSCVSDPCWYYVPGATGKEIIIFDLYPGTATDITAQNIAIKTETGAKAAVMCNSTTVTTSPGFKCWDGPYVPTKL